MILTAILRSLALLLRRRVHSLRGDVGRMLTMEDGRRFRVFRHVKVDNNAGEPGAVFVIRFTPAHMTVRQKRRALGARSRTPAAPLRRWQRLQWQ